jgi:hypothetical protein
MMLIDKFFCVAFCVRSEPSSFQEEVFLCVAVWTKQFKVVLRAVYSIMVDMMNYKNFWNFVVSTSLAFMWPCCEKFSFLGLRCFGWSVKRFGDSKLSNTLTGTEVSLSVIQFMRESYKFSTADHARFFTPRKSFDFSRISTKLRASFTGALKIAKSVFPGWNNLFFFAAVFASDRLERDMVVMSDDEFRMTATLGGEFLAAAASAQSFCEPAFAVIGQVIESTSPLPRQDCSATAPANLSWGVRRACPTWRVLRESVFWHGSDHLSCPSLRESSSFSWPYCMLTLGFNQGVLA